MDTLRRFADRSDATVVAVALAIAALVLAAVVAAVLDLGLFPALLIVAGGAVLLMRRLRRPEASASIPSTGTAADDHAPPGEPGEPGDELEPTRVLPPRPPTLAEPRLDHVPHRIAGAVAAIGLIAGGAVLLALAETDVLDVGAAWLVAAAALAFVVCVAGAMVLRAGRSLTCLGALVGVTLVGLAAADVPYGGGAGSRTYVPTSVADLAAGYELAAGRLVLDLRQLDLPPGDPIQLQAHVGLGELTVIVRDEDRVRLTGHATVGEVRVGDRTDDGLGVRTSVDVPAVAGEEHELEGSETLLELDLRVGLGEAEVVRAYAV